MLQTDRPVRRTPPAPAILAAVLALVSCAIPALFLLIVLALSEPGSLEDAAWVDFALPLLLICALLTGAVLLLLGRAWLPLAVAAGLLLALVIVGRALGGLGGGSFLLLGGGAPLLVVVLSALPGVRGWVTDRKAERAG